MSDPKLKPPGIFLRFFRWYCHPMMLDYIEGDLFEVYKRRLQKSGKRRADVMFVIDVLLLFRPGIIRPRKESNNLIISDMLRNYLKIGWRNLIRTKGYTAINVAGLTLSITCGIFIFSLVKHHLSFDNFHANGDRTYRIVTELHRDGIGYRDAVPSPLGEYVRNDFTFTEKVARIYTENEIVVTAKQGSELGKFDEPEGVSFTEPEFFDVFNFEFVHGSRESLKQPQTAVITERVAKKYYGDQDPVGQIFWLDNKHAFTVTGILKDLPSNTDLRSEVFVSWLSLQSIDPWFADNIRGWNGIRESMRCYVVLQPGTSTAEVEAVMQPYVKRFRPTSKNVHVYKLQPLSDIHFNAQYGGPFEKKKLWTLSIIGVFLIVTACVNFVNLATAQALRRSKEVGVRKVLGSMKRQLFWQFIFETGIITFMAIVTSMIVSIALLPYVGEVFGTEIPSDVFADWYLAPFIIGLGLIITLMAGYYPGLVISGFQPVVALKGKLSQRSIGGFNMRRTLIVAQFALSQVLIIGMVVIMNQMRFAQADLGFDREGVVMVYTGDDSTRTKMYTLKNEFLRLPSVEKISLCFAAPASEDDWGNSIRFDNDPEEVNFRTSIKAADQDYLATFDLPLVAGKNLQASDTVREMLINETMVRKLNLKSPEEAIGKMIVANGGSMKAPIVGVVKDFHDKSFHAPISAVLMTTYIEDYSYYAIKMNMKNASETMAVIEKLWIEQHPDQMFRYEFLDDAVARFYEAEEVMLNLIRFFSLIAIFIGSLGLYGLVSFMVGQKTKEIGIRKILGAGVGNIAGVFGKEFVYLIVIAFVIAAPVGWWLMNNWLQDYEFKTSIGVWTFIPALVCSFLVAIITVSYQVIKAAIANPVSSLRTE
jgi:putative ABC transport system permease protein